MKKGNKAPVELERLYTYHTDKMSTNSASCPCVYSSDFSSV